MTDDWMDEGLCKKLGFHTDLFFPPSFKEERTAPESHYFEISKMICEQCPVKDPCADLGEEEDHGVWGGTSPKDRKLGFTKRPTKTLPLGAMHVIPGHNPGQRVVVPELREALKGYTKRRPRAKKS